MTILQQKLEVLAAMMEKRRRARTDVHFILDSGRAACGYQPGGPLNFDTRGRDRCSACLAALRPPMK